MADAHADAGQSYGWAPSDAPVAILCWRASKAFSSSHARCRRSGLVCVRNLLQALASVLKPSSRLATVPSAQSGNAIGMVMLQTQCVPSRRTRPIECPSNSTTKSSLTSGHRGWALIVILVDITHTVSKKPRADHATDV